MYDIVDRISVWRGSCWYCRVWSSSGLKMSSGTWMQSVLANSISVSSGSVNETFSLVLVSRMNSVVKSWET